MIDENRLIELMELRIEFIEKLIKHSSDTGVKHIAEIMKKEDLEFIETIKKQPKTDAWIPVTTELPKMGTEWCLVSEPVYVTYIGMFSKKPMTDNMAVYDYSRCCWLWYELGEHIETMDRVAVEIVAWKPKMEPYHAPELIVPGDMLHEAILRTFLRTE